MLNYCYIIVLTSHTKESPLMNLHEYYNQISQRLPAIQFASIWQGFLPYKFALYSDTQCYFDGQYINLTDDFVANTAINYNGEYIAIWNIDQAPDCIDSLTACIVHEMWHAHQFTMGECRWANEMHALQHYHYDDNAISIKLHEASIMSNIIDGDTSQYQHLLALRAQRQQMFCYQYNYEAQIEQIEGSALYIELMVLKQLNVNKYEQRMAKARAQIADPNRYLPIRTVCYTVGALLLMCIDKCSNFDYTAFTDTPFSVAIVQDVLPSTADISVDGNVTHYIEQYHKTTSEIITNTISPNNIVLEGDYPLVSINIWDARQMGNYVTSTYFVAYLDNHETKVLNGDFVLLLHDNGNIAKVYNQ